MRTSFRAALAVAAATAACATGRRPPAETTPMTIQEWKGQQGGPAEAGSLVASDRTAWQDDWLRLGKPAPELDFERCVGVVVFVGQRPTGGYSVAFAAPVAKGDDLLVLYSVSEPDGFTTQAITRPWKARAFPRPKGRVIVQAAPE